MIEKYKKVAKVNVHCFACSEGAEPFSLAMILIEKLGKEKAQKFFPIIASDIDPIIIQNAKNGILKISRNDLEQIRGTMGSNAAKFKYIEHGDKFKKDSFLNTVVTDGKIKPILKDTVIFEHADIREAYADIPPKNSVVMCRNFWRYIDKYDRETLARGISNHLDKNSMFVLGEFDSFATDIYGRFMSLGYDDSKVKYCFTKSRENVKLFIDPESSLFSFEIKKNRF